MENLEFYGLTNKDNQRLYGSGQDLIDKGFDKSNFYKFLDKKRKSINGYTDLIGFEELNQGYDTLVFNSRGIESVRVLGEFIRAKDIALLENKDYIHWEFKGFDFMVKKKSFGFYKVTIVYQNLFQISFNEKMINIKILSMAFYTMKLEILYDLLFRIVLELFEVHFRENFVVSRVDYAIDVKYNFDLFNDVVKNLDFVKLKKENFKIFHEPKGKSITYTNGVAQICLYDKVLEVYHGKSEKMAIYDKLFNIDFQNSFAIEEYKNSGSQILRFEYRLNNNNDFLVKYKINIEKIFFYPNYVKFFIRHMINKHTRLEIPEDDLYKYFLQTESFNLEIETFDETRYIEQEIENCIKALTGYIASVHSKMMYLDNEMKGNFDGVDITLDYIKNKLYDFNYFEKVEKKYMDLKNRKYK